eukprot:RCo040490
MVKYDGYARKSCAKGKDLFAALTSEEHARVAETIFRAAGVGRGQLVLDWGCGCGTKLRYLEERLGGCGIGIDLSHVAAAFAQAHLNHSKVCSGDGSALPWIPDGAVDHVVSFGSLYHLYYFAAPLERYCNGLAELVRVTRPGGTVFVGCNLHNPPEAYLRNCTLELQRRMRVHLDVTIVREWNFWNGTLGEAYFSPPQDKRHGPSHTLIVRKGGSIAAAAQ